MKSSTHIVKRKHRHLIVPKGYMFIVFVFSMILAYSQNEKETLLPEKIYLQLDSKNYKQGSTVWFSAVIMQTGFTPSKKSGVLYINLIAPGGVVLDAQLVKIENGLGSGTINLPVDLATGRYLIRGYTSWNRNFGEEHFFREYINVYGQKPSNNYNNLFSSTKIIETGDSKKLEMVIEPMMVDSLHKGKLQAEVEHGNSMKAFALKEDNEGGYLLIYPIEEQQDMLQVAIKTSSGKTYKKAIALDTSTINLKFYPESGKAVAGLPAVFGFKALDRSGMGVKIAGKLYDAAGNVITVFESNDLGMGEVKCSSLKMGEDYRAKVFSVNDHPLDKPRLFDFPEVSETGTILHSQNSSGLLRVLIYSNEIENDSIRLRIRYGGIDVKKIDAMMRKGFLAAQFPVKQLPEGVLAVSVLDRLGKILAERLVYNHNPHFDMDMDISLPKARYSTREKTILSLGPTDDGALMTVLVVDKNTTGADPDLDRNIISYLKLESEVRGTIEKPGFYFRHGEVDLINLNYLLLIQGWRNYTYRKAPVEKLYPAEPRLKLKGTVSRALAKNQPKEGAEVSLLSTEENFVALTDRSDSLGRFSFDLHDQISGEIKVVLQTANKNSKNREYNLNIEKAIPPETNYNIPLKIDLVDTTIVKNLEKVRTQSTADRGGDNPFEDGEALNEVLVRDNELTPLRRKMREQHGEPDVVIEGEAIREEKEDWHFGIYSVIQSKFQDKLKFMNGELLMNFEPTIIVIDGIAVREEDLLYVPSISPDDVKSFEVIEYARNYAEYWLERYKSFNPKPDMPFQCNLIIIYTYAGKGLFGTTMRPGIDTRKIQVFSPEVTFYSPDYSNQSSMKGEDFRSTIFWESHKSIKAGQETEITFYNSDLEGEVDVIVEAISPTGQVGFSSISYKVQKENEIKQNN